MLTGYTQDRFGVIKQINPPTFNYGKKYHDNLLSRGEGNTRMAYLRYGYMMGVIKQTPNSLLEVGFGDGEFLKVCKQNISRCYGNDLYKPTLPDGCGFVENITDGSYDVVCFFDSLEHFHSIDFLQELKCGYVCLSTPNCVYYSDEWFKNWYHRKPDEHIFHFNLASLTKLFRYLGYGLMAYSHIENTIRKNGENTLTTIFKRL
jgi:hypothetical protein